MVLLPSCRVPRRVATPVFSLLDWGLRLVLLLALPAAVALLVFAKPLVAVLYHYGRFTPNDVQQTVLALSCYGVGLMGLDWCEGAGAGLLRHQDIKNTGSHRHHGAGDHQVSTSSFARVGACRFGFVDWLGIFGQRGLGCSRVA